MKKTTWLTTAFTTSAICLLGYFGFANPQLAKAASGDLTGVYGCMWNKNGSGLDAIREGNYNSISATVLIDFDQGEVNVYGAGVTRYGTTSAGYVSFHVTASVTQARGNSAYDHIVTTTQTSGNSIGAMNVWRMVAVNGGNTLFGVAPVEEATNLTTAPTSTTDPRTMVCQKV